PTTTAIAIYAASSTHATCGGGGYRWGSGTIGNWTTARAAGLSRRAIPTTTYSSSRDKTIIRVPIVQHLRIGNEHFAFGDSSGFISHDGAHPARVFQPVPATGQNPHL